ncbi:MULTISPECIES: DNA repair protein RecN [Allobacillus]|uniref:DNA repair protein RecN n=1 Tax=Allobacillus halotolerans TaxID=570278 RepID=A0ABS6GKY2_9BACI|nr:MULTISPECIES: DNA repair protein RecN [Allobacillus]MBU6079608.1 DNA repair protein RecN [Allobacillus halotolerans]TSJ68944.1 DNA repair protein RecN [Allobacillus sp. SKP2-8]
MLGQLSIKDFAIIDEITLDFKDGLTVLTGETGAGKSIIIDAIQLLAGARASVEFVRHNQDQARIEGLFFIDDEKHEVYDVLSHFHLPIDEEGNIILERYITAKGKSICRVNHKLVTLAILKEVGSKLIDIHSQHETQSLMNPEQHIELMDQFDAKKITSSKNDYLMIFNELKKAKERMKELSESEHKTNERLDLLTFQLSELQEAQLEPNEDVQLEKERNQLANYERIFDGLQTAYGSLYGENRGLDFLSNAMNALEQIEDVDDQLQKISEQMKSHYFALEELSFDIRHELDQMEFHPDRLNEIESRLFELNRLKRKYNKDLEGLMSHMAKMEEELEQLQHRETHLQSYEKQIDELTKDALIEAEQLHTLRKKISVDLTKEIQQELKDLYLEKAVFEVDFTQPSGDVNWKDKSIRLTHEGFDQVQFKISTNPGEPLKPLHKVASGGEISRIMLALKRIFSKHQGITSVIFDEVDTGVSGRVAQAIAQKIVDISKGSQVLCISHLPQVAAMADQHYRIEKIQKNGESTRTTVNLLTDEQAIEEIGRMISGETMTESTKQHAKELIEQSIQLKNA